RGFVADPHGAVANCDPVRREPGPEDFRLPLAGGNLRHRVVETVRDPDRAVAHRETAGPVPHRNSGPHLIRRRTDPVHAPVLARRDPDRAVAEGDAARRFVERERLRDEVRLRIDARARSVDGRDPDRAGTDSADTWLPADGDP